MNTIMIITLLSFNTVTVNYTSFLNCTMDADRIALQADVQKVQCVNEYENYSTM